MFKETFFYPEKCFFMQIRLYLSKVFVSEGDKFWSCTAAKMVQSLPLMAKWEMLPMTTAYYVAILRLNNLKLYPGLQNGYLLANQDDEVLMSFSENTSYTSTSMRRSVHKHNLSSGLTLTVQQTLGFCPTEITNFEFLDVSLLSFICQCYYESIDYKVKGNAFSERARAIQGKYGIPYEICKMFANLPNDETIDKVAFEIRSARLYGIDYSNVNRFVISLGEDSSKREKRKAFKELLGAEVYESLELDTRGNKYLNALAKHITSNCPELLADIAESSTTECGTLIS